MAYTENLMIKFLPSWAMRSSRRGSVCILTSCRLVKVLFYFIQKLGFDGWSICNTSLLQDVRVSGQDSGWKV